MKNETINVQLERSILIRNISRSPKDVESFREWLAFKSSSLPDGDSTVYYLEDRYSNDDIRVDITLMTKSICLESELNSVLSN